jgi:hypothetical protein
MGEDEGGEVLRIGKRVGLWVGKGRGRLSQGVSMGGRIKILHLLKTKNKLDLLFLVLAQIFNF